MMQYFHFIVTFHIIKMIYLNINFKNFTIYKQNRYSNGRMGCHLIIEWDGSTMYPSIFRKYLVFDHVLIKILENSFFLLENMY